MAEHWETAMSERQAVAAAMFVGFLGGSCWGMLQAWLIMR